MSVDDLVKAAIVYRTPEKQVYIRTDWITPRQELPNEGDLIQTRHSAEGTDHFWYVLHVKELAPNPRTNLDYEIVVREM
ncbi:MAG: hypothetical protein HC945_00605 [Nitrosarchaeum sp.]|nr:hypothetical protein [Nitrosarchaeum sp.]